MSCDSILVRVFLWQRFTWQYLKISNYVHCTITVIGKCCLHSSRLGGNQTRSQLSHWPVLMDAVLTLILMFYSYCHLLTYMTCNVTLIVTVFLKSKGGMQNFIASFIIFVIFVFEKCLFQKYSVDSKRLITTEINIQETERKG